MKRLVSTIIVCCLLLTGLAGCGSDTTSAASEDTTNFEDSVDSTISDTETETESEIVSSEEASASETEETESTLEESSAEDQVLYEPISYPLDTDVSFSWFMSYPGIMEMFVESPFYDYEAWNEWMRLTGVTIDWQLCSGSETATELFNLMIASGEYTDVFMSNLTSAMTVDEMVDQEIIYDLKGLIPENMPDYMAYIESNEDFASSIGTESSEGYWAGLHMYSDNTYANAGLVIRNDWLQEIGMDVPVTYNDLYAVLTAFKSELDADAALWINYNGFLPNNCLISGFESIGPADSSSSPFYQIDGEVFYGPINDGYKEYIKLIAQWYAEGLIYSDFMSATDSNTQPPSDIVTNNECGVYLQTLDSYHQWDDTSDTFEIVAMADMRITEDQSLHFAGGIPSGTSSTVLCVSTSCNDVETVLQAFNFDFTEEGFLVMNYGIENDTYIIDENGEPQLTDVVLNSDLPDVSLALAVYTGTDTNTYAGIKDEGRSWSLYDEAQQAASEVWGTDIDDKAYAYPTLCSMNIDESTQYNSKYSDISTYVSETTLSWIVGSSDVEADWDAYVANIQNMGIQTCIDAKQSALDRYLSLLS